MSIPSSDSSLTIESQSGVTTISISGASAMRLISISINFLIFGNVMLGCMFSVPCGQLLPTVSYLGCFSGHERIHVLACVGMAIGLGVAYIGAFVRLMGVVPNSARYVSLFLALGISSALPCLTIVDEVNGLYFAPQDWVHYYLIFALIVFSYSWVYLVYGSLSDLGESLTNKEKAALRTLRKVVIASGIATVLAVGEWQGAYSLYANSLLNENWQAVCEWAAIGLGISVPVYFCQAFEQFQIRITIPQMTAHSDASDVYLDLESEDSKS